MIKKTISFILVIVTFVSSMTTSVFGQQASIITVDGYTFEVLSNNFDETEILYNDDGESYIFTLNKMNSVDETPIEISKFDTTTRSGAVSNYTLHFDENVEYTPENMDISSVVLVDKDTNDEYPLNPNVRVVWALPVGIALTEAAVAALLEISAAIVIGGVACIVLEEAYAEIKKQKKYKYFRGYLRNNAVYAGDGIRKELAQDLAQTEDRTGTVIATTYSYATGITNGSHTNRENHGSGSGYWDHIHKLKPNGERFGAHIWILG